MYTDVIKKVLKNEPVTACRSTYELDKKEKKKDIRAQQCSGNASYTSL